MEEEISIFPERRIIYGTFWQRFAAAFLDGLILIIPQFLIGKYVGGQNLIEEFIHHNVPASSIIGQLLSSLLGLFYFAFMESSPSQATIGKQALGLKVTNLLGERISFSRAFGRNFAKNLSVLIIFIGYLMMLWDDRNQTLHDKLAGTIIIKK